MVSHFFPTRTYVEGEFPLDGSRFEGLLPPVVSGPAFTIRNRPQTICTLSDYVRQGIMDRQQREGSGSRARFQNTKIF